MQKIFELKQAYLKARKNKRWKYNTKQFSLHLEKSCQLLRDKIKNRDYKIKTSLCFINQLPIKREIFAGDFSDRVIHHLLFQKLNPYYDPLLINDCYSCRKNKGTSSGIERTKYFMRSVSENYCKKAFVLKLDIKGYFMSIDRQTLYKQNLRLISQIYKKEAQEKDEILYLLKKVIFNDPTKNCRIRGNIKNWQGLPKNKSLFYAKAGKGLPIGNLSSQLFANIYLNKFDHFIKRQLKCHLYGRYVDDMIFFHQDKEYLKNLIPQISKYLKNNLGLELHEKKIYLQEINHGVQFLGAIIKPGRIYPSSRITKNFFNCLKKASLGKASIEQINSYLGMLKQYNSYNLRKKYLNTYIGQTALKKLEAEINDDYTKIKRVIPF